MTMNYESMTVKELKERASFRKMRGYSRYTKSRMIQALKDYDKNTGEDSNQFDWRKPPHEQPDLFKDQDPNPSDPATHTAPPTNPDTDEPGPIEETPDDDNADDDNADLNGGVSGTALAADSGDDDILADAGKPESTVGKPAKASKKGKAAKNPQKRTKKAVTKKARTKASKPADDDLLDLDDDGDDDKPAKPAKSTRRQTRDAKGKLAPVKYHNIRYGKHINQKEIRQLVKEYWKGVLAVKNINFDGHYWWCTVIYGKGKHAQSFDRHRVDYLISYMRAPRKVAHKDDIKAIREALA